MTTNPFKQDTPEAILWEFLSYPLNTAEGILDRFAELPGAIRKKGNGSLEEFVYIPGTRSDRATLIAHADTVFAHEGDHKMIYEDGIIRSGQDGVGLGADDRAGCAILWLLKDTGHNLLIFDGEESNPYPPNCKGSSFLIKKHSDILKEIRNSSFMLEFDRRTAKAYTAYNSIRISQEFRDYLEIETGYTDHDQCGYTDVCVLCAKGCCGVNISVSYYNAHSSNENINVIEWVQNYETYRKMLSKPLKRYELDR